MSNIKDKIKLNLGNKYQINLNELGTFYVKLSKENKDNSNTKWKENIQFMLENNSEQKSFLDNLTSINDIVKQINTLRIIDIIATICIMLIVLLPLGITLKILIAKKWYLDLNYVINPKRKQEFEKLNSFLVELKNNKKLWRIRSLESVNNPKYNSGAGNNTSLAGVILKKKMPWYLKCNISCYCLQLDNAIIYFTPSGMLIYQNNWHVTYKSYGTLALGFDFTNFISDVITVSDAKIVGKTWKYANINGDADKRFNNNKKMNICRYGKIYLRINDEIEEFIICSNSKSVYSIQDKYIDFINCYNDITSSNIYKDSIAFIDKWNNYNNSDMDNSKKSINDDIKIEEYNEIDHLENATIVGRVYVNDNYNLDYNNINTIERHFPYSLLMTSLCYLVVTVSYYSCIIGLLNFQVIDAILSSLIALVFIPKERNILCQNSGVIKENIIIIRVILIIFLNFLVR